MFNSFEGNLTGLGLVIILCLLLLLFALIIKLNDGLIFTFFTRKLFNLSSENEKFEKEAGAFLSQKIFQYVFPLLCVLFLVTQNRLVEVIGALGLIMTIYQYNKKKPSR